MATTEYKKVWNFFFISQVDEEEQWLNSMARAGWDFVRVNWCSRYIFKRGTPGEHIYKIDLPEHLPHGLGKEEYYNFLTECGIRIVFEKKEWMYLQKKAADGPFNREGGMFAKRKQILQLCCAHTLHTDENLLRADDLRHCRYARS